MKSLNTLAVSGYDTGVDLADAFRIERISRFISTTVPNALTRLLLGPSARSSSAFRQLTTQCQFVHGALLVFPENIEATLEFLHHMGYEIGSVVPSVVVKQRLASRYELDPASLDVWITHGSAVSAEGIQREIELFMIPRSTVPSRVIDRERVSEHESHFAYKANVADEATLRVIAESICADKRFHADGGGYNPHENAARGGTTLMYFAREAESEHDQLFRRLEVQCDGNYSHVLPSITQVVTSGSDQHG